VNFEVAFHFSQYKIKKPRQRKTPRMKVRATFRGYLCRGQYRCKGKSSFS